ncbi:MAG: sulfite exporter TauE/SafE family protein [Actinomycetota bacterium]
MHALILTTVGMWCFFVALVGGLLGLVLGNIRLPVFLLVAGSPAAAGGANIAVSGLAAAAGSIAHIRAGRVHWRLVAWMLPPSVIGALAGGYAAGHLPANVLRLVIGSCLLLFGLDLLRRRNVPVATPKASPDIRAAVIAGAVIGAIGGLIGLILSTLRVPALLRWVGEEPARAVGTNLVVGVAVGAAGLLGHAPGGIDWELLTVGAATSIPGALIGSRYTGRLSAEGLLRAIGVILVISGTITIARAFL